jgi:hypothetical protein
MMSIHEKLLEIEVREIQRHGAALDNLGQRLKGYYYGTNAYAIPVTQGIVMVWYSDDGHIMPGRKALIPGFAGIADWHYKQKSRGAWV